MLRHCTSQLGDAVGMRKVKIARACQNRLEGAGIKGKRSHPELPNSLEEILPALSLSQSAPSYSLFPSPQAIVGQAGTHRLQPSSPVCNAWLSQTPGLQDGKGGLVQARGSQLERAALAHRQAVVSHWCAKKELGASIPRSHVEARMPSPQLPAHPGMG